LTRKPEPRYATEADLCADFIAWVKRESGATRYGRRIPVWTPYAETAGWDILLVAEDGTQIGIQAKLKFNMKVLTQSLPDRWEHWHDSGPDFRAVLVPERDAAEEQICAALGLGIFAAGSPNYGYDRHQRDFGPGLDIEAYAEGWHYWSPAKRCEVPEFVPDVVAGASGPVQLTKWKVAALRIVAVLHLRGYVTKADFKAVGVDPRRWTGPGGWLNPGAVPGQFVRAQSLDFDTQHPTVFAQVLEQERAKFVAEQARPKETLF
jgi:hypothetical protein